MVKQIQKKLDKLYDHLPTIVFTVFMVIFILGILTTSVRGDPLINGSEMIDNPFTTLFSPWTDFFENITGVGASFFLVPVTILTLGVYIKTNDPVTTSMFLILSGALLFTGSMIAGIPEMGLIFIIFTAMGITMLFIGILFQRREG